MTLTELTEEKIEGKSIVGKPKVIIVSSEGYPDYSDRVRTIVDAQAPEGATAFIVGNLEGLDTPTEVKIRGNIIGTSNRKHPIRTEEQVWYAHAVQYYN